MASNNAQNQPAHRPHVNDAMILGLRKALANSREVLNVITDMLSTVVYTTDQFNELVRLNIDPDKYQDITHFFASRDKDQLKLYIKFLSNFGFKKCAKIKSKTYDGVTDYAVALTANHTLFLSSLIELTLHLHLSANAFQVEYLDWEAGLNICQQSSLLRSIYSNNLYLRDDPNFISKLSGMTVSNSVNAVFGFKTQQDRDLFEHDLQQINVLNVTRFISISGTTGDLGFPYHLEAQVPVAMYMIGHPTSGLPFGVHVMQFNGQLLMDA